MHHTIDLDDVCLHYVTQGEGAPVLLLHGFPATWFSWDGVMERIADRFQFICPDLRGYNLSSKPGGVQAYRAETVAEDLVELLRVLGISRVRLVGHDWGGAIAYQLAAFHPELVSHLSVLNCPHPAIFLRHLKKNFAQLRRSWYILFFQLPWLPELLIKASVDRFLESVYRPSGAFGVEELQHYKEALCTPGALTASLNYYRAAGRAIFGPPQKWPKIECPFQLIWGVRDPALGVELTENMERYFELPPRRDYLAEAAHWVHNEQPDEVVALLEDFWVAEM